MHRAGILKSAHYSQEICTQPRCQGTIIRITNRPRIDPEPYDRHNSIVAYDLASMSDIRRVRICITNYDRDTASSFACLPSRVQLHISPPRPVPLSQIPSHSPLCMLPTPIMSFRSSVHPQFHHHTTSSNPSGLSEIATTTANALASSEDASTYSNTSPLPFILGPILATFGLGGLYFLWHHFYKRRQAKHLAPSAEFQKYRRSSSPIADIEAGGASGAGAAEGKLRIGGKPALYAHHDNGGQKWKWEGGDDGSPPSFAPGLFKDPIFEKGVAISLANQRCRPD